MGLVSTVRSVLARAAAPLGSWGAPPSGRGWFPIVIREPYTGAWQSNEEIRPDSVLANAAVFACVTLIASSIAKVNCRLVALTDDGVWIDTTSTAFSPVLRKPNRYQNRQQFFESWLYSKLIFGNAYILKQRDARGVVVGMFVLNPAKVTPLVTADGAVYYQLSRDDLSGVPAEPADVAAPAREIIHDRFNTLFHPLVGVSPLFACAGAALQGLSIQQTSTKFFGTGAQPGGVLTAPGKISDETAKRLSEYWNTNFSGVNVGKVAVVGDGLKYEALTANAVDSQLIEQLKWTTETVCSAYHVPASLIDSSHTPPYANSEPLVQQFYAQCLQSLMTSIELCLDEGLELPTPYGTEFDIDDLVWMDTATKTKAAHDGIAGGALSPDEARRKYFGLGKVTGGSSPYLQQQNFSLAALAERDANDPFAKPRPAPTPAPEPELDDNEPDEDEAA